MRSILYNIKGTRGCSIAACTLLLAAVMLTGCSKEPSAGGDTGALKFTATAEGYGEVSRAYNLELAGGSVDVTIGGVTKKYDYNATTGLLEPADPNDAFILTGGTTSVNVSARATLIHREHGNHIYFTPAYFADASAAVTWTDGTPGISMAFKPASARISVVVKGGYGETVLIRGFEAEIAAPAPHTESGRYVWDATTPDKLIPSPTETTVTVTAEPGAEPGMIVPTTIARNETILTLTEVSSNNPEYAGNVYDVRCPDSYTNCYAFQAGKHYLITVQLHDGAPATVSIGGIEDFEDGDPIEGSNYPVIRTKEQFDEFMDDWLLRFNSPDDATKEAMLKKWTGGSNVVRLGADIEVGDRQNMSNLGSDNYKVVFDGGGHTLSGMTRSFIGTIASGSEVRNLNIRNSTVTDGSGIIANNNYGTIAGCTVHGNVSSSTIHIGGIVGANYESGLIIACGVLEGTIIDNSSNLSTLTGGIAGLHSGTMVGCWSAATSVTSTSGLTGGIIGQSIASSIAEGVCHIQRASVPSVPAGSGSINGSSLIARESTGNIWRSFANFANYGIDNYTPHSNWYWKLEGEGADQKLVLTDTNPGQYP